MRPAVDRAKIPVQDVDFQMLRRSFATVSQFVGLDLKAIQAQLGHARPDMTAVQYMQPVDALTISQMSHLEDLLRGRIAFPVDITARIGTAVSIQ
jgi:integrase